MSFVRYVGLPLFRSFFMCMPSSFISVALFVFFLSLGMSLFRYCFRSLFRSFASYVCTSFVSYFFIAVA